MSIMILAAVLVVLGCWGTIIGMGYWYEKNWTKDFGLEISFSQQQAAEGDTLWLYEVITNNKEMILPAVSVRFKTSKFLKFEDMDSGSVSDYFYRNDVISVRGYEQVRRKLRIRCARRGIYSIQEAELAGRDYFLQRTYLDKKEVVLVNKEFELLLFLAENPNLVFSKDTLFDRVWGMDSLGDAETVTVHINRLRDKLGKNESKNQFIETVWGAGYRFRID